MKRLGTSLALLALTTAACSGGAGMQARPGPGKPGGRIVVAITEPGALDPARAYDPAGEQVQSLLCEPLITRDPRTGKLTTRGLASYWITTSRGSQLTVRLRKGLRFSDGTKVNANDVLASWSRAAAVETASPDADVFEELKGYDTVHGLVETDDTTALTKLKGVAPLSDTSLSFTLSQRDAAVVERLSHPITAITPGRAGQDARFATRPVCIGPYALSTRIATSAKSILLTRSAHYYGANTAFDSGGRGYADSIEFRVFASRAAAVAAFRAGSVDMAPVPTELLDQPVPPGASLVHAPNGTVDYLGLPTGNGSPYADPAVRRALSEALDRSALARVAFRGAALPATGFVPPSAGGDFRTDACGDAVQPATDLSALRATVKAATLGKPGLSLSYPDVDVNAAVAREVQRQWKTALGLDVTLDPLTPGSFLQKATSADGFRGAFLEGWRGLSPSAEDYLAPLLSGAATGTSNIAHYSQPAFERALREARQDEDTSGRRLAYQGLEDKACQSLPLIPLVFREWSYLVRTSKLSTSNASWTDKASGLLDLRDVWLS